MTFPGTSLRCAMIFAATSSPWRGPWAALAGLAVMLSTASGWTQDAGPEGAGPFRKLAPGVERTIPPQIQKEETATWVQKLDELARLAAEEQVPELGKRPWAASMLENIRITHDVWCLEFSFKPVRFVTVE